MNRGAPLARRLLFRSALAVLLVLAGLAVLLDRTLEGIFLEDLTRSLAAQARAARSALTTDSAQLQGEAARLAEDLGVRITVVRSDGVVLADSERDPAGMENHGGRPEIRAALSGHLGVASRTSETTGEPYRYVAVAPEGGAVVRVALPLSVVEERLQRVRGLVVGGSSLAALLALLAVWLVARDVTRPLREVTEAVERVSAGTQHEPVPETGAAELAVLGGTINRMRAELEIRIEEARRDRQEREAILAAMQEGVLLVGPDGSVAYANPASERLLGRIPAAIRDLTPSPLEIAVLEAAADRSPREAEIEIGVPPRVVRASAVPLTQGVLLVLRDVTEARRVETMRRDFVADASHELKTPAASIRAAAETVERAVGEDPEAAARFATRVRREAERLSGIVSDLLDLSRLETQRVSKERVRLDRIVQEEVGRLQAEARERGVRVEMHAGETTVDGAPKDLALLVRNLLDNALRHTSPGGVVTVSVGRDGGDASLIVADDGVGIPSRDLPRIFERFYRVDRARSRDTGGTGLGLSIARHVVEQHGGTIEAKSELGAGSTFSVTIPAGTG